MSWKREAARRALVQEDASEPEKTCPNCHKSIPLSRLWSNWNTCACGYHFRMGGRQRLRFLADKGSFQELFSQVEGRDPLSVSRLPGKAGDGPDASSEKEAVLCGHRPDRGCALLPVYHGALLYDGEHGHGGGRKDHQPL